MKSTSRGCRQAGNLRFFILVFMHLMLHFPAFTVHAEQERTKGLVFIEFSQKGIDVEDARRYFDGMQRFLREELSLEPLKGSSLRRRKEGPDTLPPVPVDTLFRWREMLGRGKQFFKELKLDEVAEQYRELVDSPYHFTLGGKALDLVSEAMLSYSFILFKTGDREGSERLIARYDYLSGKSDVSDKAYPPDFVDFFHRAISKEYFVTIAVNSTPSSARVFLGDRIIGETPLVEKVEKPGLFKLSVRKEGYVKYVISRFALPGDRLHFDLNLEIDEVSEIEHGVDRGNYEEVVKNLRKLNERMNVYAGLTVVLKGDVDSGSVDFLLSAGEKGLVEESFSIFRDMPRKGKMFALEDIQPLLEDELFLSILPDSGKARALGEGLKKKRLTEKWWFWAIVAAGAAGIVYAIAEGKDNKPGGTVNVEF